MIKDILIGTVAGVSAIIAGALLLPRQQDNSASREIVASYDSSFDRHGLGLGFSTRPDTTALKLEKIIQNVEVKNGRLDKLLAFLADSTGVNMTINWRALEAAGVSQDATVTLKLHKVPARVVLKEVLIQIGGGIIPFRYRITEGIVQISTADDLSRDLLTRVYDVSDLVAECLDQWKRDGTNGTEQEALDKLVRMIQETITPTVWDGERQWGMRMYRGKLVVTMPVELHEELIELLAGLRAKSRG